MSDQQHQFAANAGVVLRNLLLEYEPVLRELPAFDMEVKSWLKAAGVDWEKLIAQLEAQLSAATSWLLEHDLTHQELRESVELANFMHRATSIVTSKTLAEVMARYHDEKRCVIDSLACLQRIALRRASAKVLGYVDNADGTVTHSQLMWKQCAEGQEGTDCIGQSKTCSWLEAMRIPTITNGTKGFAKFHDWRLPTREELATLVVDGRRPTICSEAFPNSPVASFWSSNTGSPGQQHYAWSVCFSDGHMGRSFSDREFNVRLVRDLKSLRHTQLRYDFSQ